MRRIEPLRILNFEKLDVENLPLDCFFTCAVCGKFIEEITNIGRWLCRYHPGNIVKTSYGTDYFDCCGLEDKNYYLNGGVDLTTNKKFFMSNINGCVRCDHMIKRITYNKKNDIFIDTKIPLGPLSKILSKDNIQNIFPDQSRVVIRRFDAHTASKVIGTSINSLDYSENLCVRFGKPTFVDTFFDVIDLILRKNNNKTRKHVVEMLIKWQKTILEKMFN